MTHRLRLALAALLLWLPALAQAEPVLRIGVIGELAGTHANLRTTASAGLVAGMAARGLTYFDGQVSMACLLCDVLPTAANGGVVDDVTPEGEAGQRVTFRLKPGLKWDDGTPLTARDFVLAWTVGRAPDSAYAWRSRLAEEIWSVTAPDDRTVEVRRRGRSCRPNDFRFAPLPSRLEGALAAGDARGYAHKSLYVTAPTTRGLYNGPYRVSGFTGAPGDRQRLVLERNPHWAGPKPTFDRVEFVYRPTAAAMAQALAAGEVDLMANASLDIADEVARSAPGRFVDVRRAGRPLMQVALNHDDPRLADARVRRALLEALDRPALAASFGPKTVAATSFLTPRFPHFDKTIAAGSGRTGAAARLLDEAGWTLDADDIRRAADGRTLSFRLAVQRSQIDKPFVAAIVDAWRGIGVEARIEPWGGIAQLTASNPPPMALFGYLLEGATDIDFEVFGRRSIPRPDEVRNGLNIFRYRNAEVDRVVELMRGACDAAELAPAYATLQRRVAEDLPLLPLFFMPEAHLLPPGLVPPQEGRLAYLLTEEVESWRWRSAGNTR